MFAQLGHAIAKIAGVATVPTGVGDARQLLGLVKLHITAAVTVTYRL
jgi:hypothetical protein